MGDDVIEFVKVTAATASTSSRVLTVQAAGVGAEGDDDGAQGFDSVEVAQPAGIMASPTLTATTEAVAVRRGDELIALVLIDKGAAAQSVEAGETRLYGVGSDNATAVIRLRANGDVEITAKSARAIRLATSGGGDIVLNGGTLKVARVTDAVSVQLTVAEVGGITAPPGGGPCTLTAGSLTLSGTIGSGGGATNVKA
jgi:hypothetical protein